MVLEADPMIRQDVKDWFDSPLGQSVRTTEQAIIDQLLPGFFGYHLLQIGMQDQPLYETSPIHHKFIMAAEQGEPANFVGSARELPFEDDSIDVVLLHHLLDFYDSPQEILREAARVSLPQGHLVIVGFNPLSLWGMYRPLARLKSETPWKGQFVRATRLMDWLNLLNFKIDRAQFGIYRPPLHRFISDKAADYSHGLSRYPNWPFGAIYVIVARKQVSRLQPIRPIWRAERSLPKLSVVRPASRDPVSRIRDDS